MHGNKDFVLSSIFQYVDGCHHTKYTIAASPRELQTDVKHNAKHAFV